MLNAHSFARLGIVLVAISTHCIAPANAQSMHTLAALETAAQRQQNWAEHRAWVQTDKSGTIGYASGVILDQWNVLISAHQAFSIGRGFTDSFVVGRGSNFMTTPGATFDAADVVIHPEWNGGPSPFPFQNTVDVAILHMTTPIPGVTPLTIGSAQLGQQLVGVGYGRPATPAGYLEDDGQARAFNLYVDEFGLGSTVPIDYMRGRFLPLSWRNDPLAGGGTPGNSGGGVFNADGELVGLTVGVAGSPPGYFYDTASLRLDLYESWIRDNMIVPAPASVALFAAACLATGYSRRRTDTRVV